jgi:Flp pilus assembly protein CpaB
MKGILRSATFLVGLALTVGAFLAFLILGNVFNPPPYQVVVVVRDVTPGTPLTKDLLTTSAQGISSRVAAGYVLAGELSQYLGATIIEPMHPGDPLTKSRLVKDGNPAAIQRAALGLDDPAKTLMVVPVDDKTAPDNIAHGDHMDLVYTVGREPTSTETQNPSGYTAPGSTGGMPEEEEETLALPLAKLVFKNLKVARIHREKQPNPSYSGGEGESPYIEGKLNGLEVVVDREQEELLGWAVQHGKVRVALLSPNAPMFHYLNRSPSF